MKKDILINIWASVSILLLLGSLLACQLMGDKFIGGHYVHGDYSLAAYLLLGSLASVVVWLILTLALSDDGKGKDNHYDSPSSLTTDIDY